MLFYLGTHETSWLRRLDVPLFVSDVRLRVRRGLPRARTRWALDSGGYSALAGNGRWPDTAREYVARVRRYRKEIGLMDWAPVRDWMCEDQVLRKTGLTVAKHQELTIDSLVELSSLAPELHWVPVIQGRGDGSHLDHVEQYARRGIDLTRYRLVGVGSVCRLQSEKAGAHIIRQLSSAGLTRLHGFGFKLLGLARVGHLLSSADSLAWSYTAYREQIRLRGCRHKNCANCAKWAIRWRRKVFAASNAPCDRFGATHEQLSLVL